MIEQEGVLWGEVVMGVVIGVGAVGEGGGEVCDVRVTWGLGVLQELGCEGGGLGVPGGGEVRGCGC